MNNNHQDNGQELAWLAFRYVSDELSVEETAAFEERLASDQAAREAVAEAVLLCEAVSAGESVAPASVERRSWRQHLGWAAIGAAACLLLVLAIRSGEQGFQPPVASTLTSADLALVWAQNLTGHGTTLADTANDEDLGLASDVDRELVVPGWMIEALSGSEEAKAAPVESKES